tara:strand:- start:5569 stop:6309 length:741 start_codon:yes stop_codon:yes gene_type:complete
VQKSIKSSEVPVVILAGGLGTRIAENREKLPKGLVKIGNYPIIYHVIRYFKSYGFKKFIICIGYKGDVLKKYFIKEKNSLAFKDLDIRLIDTGIKSNTGLRIKKIKNEVKNIFFLTYCDGLINLNLKKLLTSFTQNKKLGIVTAVNAQSRFGILSIKGDKDIVDFDEKKKIHDLWINAGYYIFNKKIFDYIPSKNPIFESEVLKKIAKRKLIMSYKHRGFWKCMDTIKDKNELNKIWQKNAPWKIW